MEDVVYSINPVESPIIGLGTKAERTVLKFSNNDSKIRSWIMKRERERFRSRKRYEWIVDEKPA